MKPFPRSPRGLGVTGSSSAEGRPVTKPKGGGYGHNLPQRKREGNIRILFQNCGGFSVKGGIEQDYSYKIFKLKELLLRRNFDVCGLAEMNRDWRAVKDEERLDNVIQDWTRDRRSSVAYNAKAPVRKKFQSGGTAMMAFDDICHSEVGSERGWDPRGLGRWNSMTFRGIYNSRTTIISAYCPVKSTNPGGAYMQQVAYIQENLDKEQDDPNSIPLINNRECPRELFGADVKKYISEKMEDGHQILLMGDFNSDFQELKEWMQDLLLEEIITKLHPDKPLQKTYKRSQKAPLDGIFASPGLLPTFSGYLSFGRLIGDHRGIWVEFSREALLGVKIPAFIPLEARRLKNDDPRVVAKYRETLHKKFLEHDLYERLDEMYKNIGSPLLPSLQAYFEELDFTIRECMQEAERKCRNYKMGVHEWTPVLEESRQVVDYWRRRISHVLGDRQDAAKMKRIQKRLKISYKRLNIKDLHKELSKSLKRRGKIYKNAESLKLDFRKKLAAAQAAAGKGSISSKMKEMEIREKNAKRDRRIKYVNKKLRNGATSRLDTLDEDGTVVEVTTKNGIEEILLETAKIKLHQAEGSSQLLEAFLQKDIGKFGEGPKVEAILDGTYIPPEGTSDATKDFLKACKRPDDFEPTPPMTEVESFLSWRDSWKIRKEKTMTFNEHLGHYKACMGNDQLSWALYQRSMIPLEGNYSPKRHRSSTYLSIQKKKESSFALEQRFIAILDGEKNQQNKIMQKDAMNKALKYTEIATEQYSRPGRNSLDHALNRRLVMDHRQYQRKPYAIGMSDLKGCYDRIIHNAAALALLRIGVSHKKIHSMFRSIQNMIHKVRTVFGDSEGTIGGEEDNDPRWENEPQGMLQGNAAGPVVWAVLSSIIFKILRKKGYSDEFCSCLSKQLFELVGFAYVDDCDLIQSGDTPEEVKASMQNVMDEWADLMQVTGGALESKKSYWYLVDFEYARGKWRAIDPEIEEDTLTAKTPEGRKELKRLSALIESEMLGIWMSPAGNRKIQLEKLKERARNWAVEIKRCNLSQEDIMHALQTTILKALQYPLLPHSFTKEECRSIMFQALKIALPKSGFSQRISSEIRHGPNGSLGIGIPDLYVYAGSAKITALVDHLWQDTPTGKLLKVCIEDFLLDSGFFGNINDLDFGILKKWACKHSWIYDCLKFMHEFDIDITIKHEELRPKREGDRAIMEVASKMQGINLKSINRVRMFQEIISIADITTADGKKIDDTFLQRAKVKESRNNFLWPHKHRVTSEDFRQWNIMCKQLYILEGQLSTPLYNWISITQEEWTANWNWFSNTRGQLFRRQDKTWYKYRNVGRSVRTYYSVGQTCTQPSLNSLSRASVKSIRNRIIITNSCSIARNDRISMQRKRIIIGNREIPDFKIAWIMENFECSDSIGQLIKDVREGKAICVTDGSYFEIHDTMSASFIIISENKEEYIMGGGIIPGEPEDGNSYRAELGGLLGIGVAIESLSFDSNNPNVSVTVACDNEKAVKKLGVPKQFLKKNMASIDLISEIESIWSDSKVQPNPVHVYGHLDEKKKKLTWIETLNVLMDQRAKQIAIDHFTNRRNLTNAKFSEGIGSIKVGETLISSNIQRSLEKAINHSQVIGYLGEQLSTNPEILQKQTNWISISRARFPKKQSYARRKFLSKIISGDLPTGETMTERKHKQSATCPFCTEKEDIVHIFTCSSQKVTSKRQELLRIMKKKLAQMRTEPTLYSFITKGIETWVLDPLHDSFFIPLQLQDTKILLEMENIGWYGLLLGLVPKSFTLYQHQYYQDKHLRNTGHGWTTKVCILFWDFLLQMWIHRNEKYHSEDIAYIRQGGHLLDTALLAERYKGIENLHRSLRAFFSMSPTTISKLHSNQKLDWLRVIRLARERSNTSIIDEFTSDNSLREWVGLPRVVPPRE